MYTKNKTFPGKKQASQLDFSKKITDERAFYLFKAGLSLKEHALLELIQDFANTYGMRAAPSHAWLGKRVGHCRQTVCAKLASWKRLGFMDWIYRHRKTSIYKAIRFSKKLVLSLLVAAKSAVSQGPRHQLIKKDFYNNSYKNMPMKKPAALERRPQNGGFNDAEEARLLEQARKRVIFNNKCTDDVIKANEEARKNSKPAPDFLAERADMMAIWRKHGWIK